EADAQNPEKTAAEAEQTSGYDKNRPTHRPEPEGLAGGSGQSDGATSFSQGPRNGQTFELPQAASDAGSDAGQQTRQERRQAMVRDGSQPEHATPLPPEASAGESRPRRGASKPRVIAAVTTAALPVVMWLFGRDRTRRSA